MKTRKAPSHTPTPWKIGKQPPNQYSNCLYLDGGNGLQIRITSNDATTVRADATLIVRAVNEYEKNQSVIGKLTKEVDRLEHAHEELVSKLTAAYVGLHMAWGHDGYFHECKITSCVVSRVSLATHGGRGAWQAEGK